MSHRFQAKKVRESKSGNAMTPNQARFVKLITKHGKSQSRIYMRWMSMRGRCEYPGAKGYKNYGARGITVCDRWKGPNGFQNFLADMGDPGPGFSLERNDNDGPYSPQNCRWASRAEQSRNSRRNVYVTVGSETLCLMDWAKRADIAPQTIRRRMDRGITGEALLKPSGYPKRSHVA